MDNLENRYSSALLEIALEEKSVKQYRDCIKEIQKCLKDNPEYLHVLSSAFISKDEKYALVKKAFASLPFKHIVNFIGVIIDNERINELPHIFDRFISLCNDHLGVEEGFVYSTLELSKLQIDKIEKAIGERLKKEVELKNIVDESLIGGIKVVIHDRVFDGSLSSKFKELENKLLKGKVTHNGN